MKQSLAFMLVIVAVLAAEAPLPAQLSFAATYDDGRQVALEGPVTRIEWVNPRAFLLLNVRDASGIVANWAVEIGNPIALERAGWTEASVRIGDVVRVEGIPARHTLRQAFARSVVAAGTRTPLFVTPASPAVPPAAAAPRWPDGRVRLGPAPGRKGYWGTPGATALVERAGAPIPMTPEGLLINLSDADRVAPFRPWAKAIYMQRQRTLLEDDPLARCLPPGGPRQFHSPNGFQFVEQPALGRVLVLFGGGNRNWRVIHTDGRAPGQPADVVLGYYGYSVGRWANDTLIVESLGYTERFWLSNGGIPHTEALRLTERFTRTDLNTLQYEVTVDDPRTYTRPWSGGWTVGWVPDAEIQEYFCEENAESTFIR